MASHRTVAELGSVNRAVAAPTVRGQTTVEPIPAAAHEANRETEKVVTTVAEAEVVVVVAIAAIREAAREEEEEEEEEEEPTLSWTQTTKPLYRRDSQHSR